MPRDGLDISVSGDKSLALTFGKMPIEVQKKVVRPALRKSAKRFKGLIVQAYSGVPVGVVTGDTLFAMTQMKVRSRSSRRDGVSANVLYPETDESPPPWIIMEYGSRFMAARAPIRKLTNANQDKELGRIMDDIETNTEKVWAKAARSQSNKVLQTARADGGPAPF
jgi:hypothetical protein